ncbi:hypothetical protein BH10PLA1_BH10PLA1_14920 [soil metagenome]
MKTTTLSVLEVALIGGTRAARGAGVALLLGDRIKNNEQRRAVAYTLIAVGAITTVPILLKVLFSSECEHDAVGGRLASEEYSQ